MSLLEKFQREMQETQVRIKAAEAFPDLEEIKDQWGIVRLVTDAVNEKAINFEVRNECDCCNGVKVFALPHIDFEGIRLYSKTPAVSFAKLFRGPKGSLYVEDDDWEDREEWQKFNGLLLDKVVEWIDKRGWGEADDPEVNV